MLIRSPCLLFFKLACLRTSALYYNYICHQKVRSVLHPPPPFLQPSQAVLKFSFLGTMLANGVLRPILSSFKRRKMSFISRSNVIGILYFLSHVCWRLAVWPNATFISLISCFVSLLAVKLLRLDFLIILRKALLVETKKDLLSRSAYATDK